MDIVNWLYLKKAELIRDTISSPEDLVLLGADVSFDKRGDKYLTYAVPVSLIGGGGSGITLKTNGTDNTVQNILDLVEGDNITITDNGDGSVTIDSAIGLIDADNGLNIGASGVAYLGGALLETTTIDTTSQYQLNITGANNQIKGEVLFVENTSNASSSVIALNANCDIGRAITATSISGIGIDVTVDGTGKGISTASLNGYGLVAISGSEDIANESRPIYAYGGIYSRPSLFLAAGDTNNSGSPAIAFRKSSPAPLVGFGPSIQFEVRGVNSSTNILTSSTIASVYVDTTLGSESTALEFSVRDTGTLTKVLVMESSGIFTLTQGLGDYIDDAAAQAANVPINGLYRTGSIVKIRVS